MKKIIVIHTILKSFRTKKGNYGVELAIRYDTKKLYWLSEKQYIQLRSCFMYNDYSTKHYTIYAVIDEDRFVWCSNEPNWMIKVFKVDNPEIPIVDFYISSVPPKLEIPENVEINDELKDDII